MPKGEQAPPRCGEPAGTCQRECMSRRKHRHVKLESEDFGGFAMTPSTCKVLQPCQMYSKDSKHSLHTDERWCAAMSMLGWLGIRSNAVLDNEASAAQLEPARPTVPRGEAGA